MESCHEFRASYQNKEHSRLEKGEGHGLITFKAACYPSCHTTVPFDMANSLQYRRKRKKTQIVIIIQVNALDVILQHFLKVLFELFFTVLFS